MNTTSKKIILSGLTVAGFLLSASTTLAKSTKDTPAQITSDAAQKMSALAQGVEGCTDCCKANVSE